MVSVRSRRLRFWQGDETGHGHVSSMDPGLLAKLHCSFLSAFRLPHVLIGSLDHRSV